MALSHSGIDEDLDDVFDLDNSTYDTETLHQRVKEFTYYLVENLEYYLNLCLHILEERPVPTKPTSSTINALSALCSAIPKIGGAVATGLRKGEAFIFSKIDKKNSRKLAELVYYFSDNKTKFREVLIDAALETFSSFEVQFMKLSCNGGKKRAMQKLAVDASDRIFSYFLLTEQEKDVTKKEIVEGILSGDSKRNRMGIKEGKEVKEKDKKWKTCKMYSKVGIVINNSDTYLFYKQEQSKPQKYGYRKILSWENFEDIMKTFILDNHYEIPVFKLEVTPDLTELVRKYIMTKNQNEDAKLDREEKYQETMRVLKESFNKFYDAFSLLEENIISTVKKSESVLTNIVQNQEEDSKKQELIITKLDEVHVDVKEYRVKQDVLEKVSENIQNNVVEIKSTQVEISGAMVRQEHVADLVKEHSMDATKENLKEIIDDAVKSIDPGRKIKEEVKRTYPRIKEEVERTIPRIEAEVNRFTPRVENEVKRTLEKIKHFKF